MVVRTSLDFLIIEPETIRAGHVSLQVARAIVEVAPGQPHFKLLTNLSETQVFISKHMLLAQIVDRPQLVAPTEPMLSDSEPDKVDTVYCKPSVDRDN